MESLFVFAFLFLAAIIVLPIIILVRLSGIERKISNIEEAVRLQKFREKASEQTEKPQEETTRQVIVPEKTIVEPLPAKESAMEEAGISPETEWVAEAETEHETETEIPAFAAFTGTKEPEKKPIAEENQPWQKLGKGSASTFENLLSKIGIVTLVLGIGFFVKYAIDKDWINEVGRVAIGVITGGGIIALAHKLREKYNVFSAILVGGGISVLYITITLAFREYELFSQTVAFIILIAITLFSVLLSLLYNRKELALFSLLGGYASPLMISSGEGNYIVLFSFIFILNSGMLLISMRRKWNIIGIVSFFCTLLFYWAWLILSFDNQYAGAFTFGILFFVQFYLLALFDHFLSGKNISPFQVVVILANNLSLFAASILIIDTMGYKLEGLVTLAMSVANALVMLWLFKFKRANVDKRLIYLIIAVVLSFVSLAIPVQLKGHVITMFWAAEMVILLWMWLKSGIKVFRTGFMLISVLTLVSYFMDVNSNYMRYNELPILFNRMFVTGVVLIASLAVCRTLLHKVHASGADTTALPLARMLNIAGLGMAYLVPLFEINYQLTTSWLHQIGGFNLMILSAYTAAYVAALIFIYRKDAARIPTVYMLFGFILLYVVVALPTTVEARGDIMGAGYGSGLFLTHYLALPGLIYIVYVLVKNLRILPRQRFIVCSWALVIASVIILSVELDSTIAQVGASTQNYNDLMYDVHTFGYPILWGLLAMCLMIWGMKVKEVLLRKISLVFFAFIILKFYISDIWLMSQTGRIISFVALGVILLLASFLIQKIKILIKDDHENETGSE